MERSRDYWMKAALRQAQRARDEDETPVGAVVVRDGRVVGRGHNQRESRQDVTLHAEMAAIRQACRRLGSWRLDGCELYVTLEPCVMCAGAIVQARISRVIYGAPDPKAGAAGSVTDVFSLRLNHQVDVVSGVLSEPCSLILKEYFKDKRQQDKAGGSKSRRKAAAISRLNND